MKTLDQTMRFLFRLGTNAKKPAKTASGAGKSEIKTAPQPKAHPCTDDDSPPGYKIRWHQ
jgi:hypothetical protein